MVAEPRILLPWGKADSQLGLYKDGTYLRGPEFFCLDEKGNCYVADAYKERVAVYDAAGRFLSQLAIGAVSPRTTYFKRAGDGSFVICNDMEISRWSAKGERIGGSSLGLGLPKACFATDSMAAAWLQVEDGEACRVFSRDFGEESVLALKRGDRLEAAFQDASGRYWFPHFAYQRAFYRWETGFSGEAVLFDMKKDGSSIWLEVGPSGAELSFLEASGRLGSHARLPLAPDANRLPAFAIGADGSIYYGLCEERGFIIRRLE